MAKPMILYAGIYNSAAEAELDYQAIEALHGPDAIGSYDSAIIIHDPDGGVKLTATEKPVKHGAWIDVATGADAAVVVAFLLREIGDWDEAEQDALDSTARAEQDAVV